MLSVIIPAFNEAENIINTSDTITHILKNADIKYELIFVDDGSKDLTYEQIKLAHSRDSHVTGLRFSRNFGKEAAILAGLSKAHGECAAVIDCDLQHPPECLVKMYALWKEGYQIIEGVKNSRGSETLTHKMSAGIFYHLISKAVGIDMNTSSDFKLLDRKVIDIITSLPERDTFFRALTFWTGFKSTSVTYDVADRQFGETKWSTFKLIKYAINNITSFTSMPLHMITGMGIVLLFVALVLGIQTLIKYISGNAAEGFTTVILLMLIIGGCIMISLGIIGIYISKIYNEVKHRPAYIVLEECSLEEK